MLFGSLAGPVVIDDSGTTGVDSLTLVGTSASDTITVTSSQVQRQLESVSLSTKIESLLIQGGNGDDHVTVNSTTIPVTFDGQGGGDQLIVQLGNLLSPVSMNDPTLADNDSLVVLGTDNADSISVSSTGVQSAGQSVNLVTPVAALSVDAGAGNDTISVTNLASQTSSLSVVGGQGTDMISLTNIGTSVANVNIDGGGGGNDQVQIQGTVPTNTVVSNVAPTASIQATSSRVRGQQLNVQLSATDVDVADRVAGFTYIVRWNDGSPTETIFPTAGNGAGTTLPHVFKSIGTYVIDVTATDKSGAVSLVVSKSILVSKIALQVDPVNPSLTALAVGGSLGNDKIEFEKKLGQEIRVEIEHDMSSTFSPTGRILVFGQSGDDTIEIDDHISLTAEIYGGEGNDELRGGSGNDVIVDTSGNNRIHAGLGNDSVTTGNGNDQIWGEAGDDIIDAGDGNNTIDAGAGNDVVTTGSGQDAIDAGAGDDLVRAGAGNDNLQGGSGNDILLGGDGNDQLEGGAGRDLMIGGLGADRLFGNADDDLLIAGYTSYDANDLALLALALEWSSNSSYAMRVSHLQSGTGLTGGRRLDGNDGAAQTVFNDNDVDELTGNAGQDWFFANQVADNGGVLDKVIDKAANEQWDDTDF